MLLKNRNKQLLIVALLKQTGIVLLQKWLVNLMIYKKWSIKHLWITCQVILTNLIQPCPINFHMLEDIQLTIIYKWYIILFDQYKLHLRLEGLLKIIFVPTEELFLSPYGKVAILTRYSNELSWNLWLAILESIVFG